jgi:hypothetical protein
MRRGSTGDKLTLPQLVLVPTLISLAVTLWRLSGELLQWSTRYFDPSPGGGGSLIGITWLAPLFGIYFALNLAGAGRGPRGKLRPIGFALLGVAVAGPFFFGAERFLPLETMSFTGILLILWSAMAVAAALQFPGWPELFKVLLVYAYAARIPVAVIMFLAMRGNWGTHYDVAPEGFPEMAFLPRYLWLGFFPQLVFWVGFTIVVGSLSGGIAAALAGGRERAPSSGSN